MEMSQRIRFWYQILLKMLIFLENGKKSLFLVKFFLWQAKKNNFELEMLKLLENHLLRWFSKNLQIFELGNIFENFDHKSFLPENHLFAFFGTLWSKFFKNIA